jgi:hypothetical protein
MFFENGLADFGIQNDGGLNYELFGKGKFEILDRFLLIYTTEYKGEKSSFKTNEKTDQYSKIIVRDERGALIPFINIAFIDSMDKVFDRGFTDTAGRFLIKNPDKICKLQLKFLGYCGLTINFKSNIDYQVILVDGMVIENKIVVFKINKIENNKMKLVLLTTNYKSNGCNSKTLKRMYKKVKKYVDFERVFIK